MENNVLPIIDNNFDQFEDNSSDIFKAFLNQWVRKSSPNSVLQLTKSKMSNFLEADSSHNYIIRDEIDNSIQSKFDLILGDGPTVRINNDAVSHSGLVTYFPNSNEIVETLGFLSDNGNGIFFFENSGLLGTKGKKFINAIKNREGYINAIFEIPENFPFQSEFKMPHIIVISKQSQSKMFVARLVNVQQAEQVVNSYFKAEDGHTLLSGKYIEPESFNGFHSLSITDQFNHLKSLNETYSQDTLGNMAKEIKRGSSDANFEDLKNCVYIPSIGMSPVFSKLSELKNKQQNYYQVVLKESVNNEYVTSFFNTNLGILVRETTISHTFIPHLNKRDLLLVPVFFPSMDEQIIIVNTQDMLARLKIAIDEVDTELALNPRSATSLQNQLNSMLDSINKLSDVDRVYAEIRLGETKKVEFKETFSFDVKKNLNAKQKYIETESLKTIVAFLNTDGGNLLIGVTDEGKVTGIDHELAIWYKNKTDKFFLYVKDKIKERLGEQFFPYIDQHIVSLEDKIVCVIECSPSKHACFLDGEDFYIRVTPASIILKGYPLIEYAKIHFQSQAIEEQQ